VVAAPALAALALSGCGGDDAGTTASEPAVSLGETPNPTDGATTVSPTSAPATTVDSAGSVPATTTRPATSPPTSAAELVAAAPEDATVLITDLLGDPPPVVIDPTDLAELVADALASAGDPTQVDEVSSGEPATAVITLIVREDDSIGGVRYTITMEGDDSLGWVVASATSENLCRRGVDGPLCV
jgi:hypothetical protein